MPSWNSYRSQSAAGSHLPRWLKLSLPGSRWQPLWLDAVKSTTHPLGCLFLNWQMSPEDNWAFDLTITGEVQHRWTPSSEQQGGVIPHQLLILPLVLPEQKFPLSLELRATSTDSPLSLVSPASVLSVWVLSRLISELGLFLLNTRPLWISMLCEVYDLLSLRRFLVLLWFCGRKCTRPSSSAILLTSLS